MSGRMRKQENSNSRKRKYYNCYSCIEADECDDMVSCDNCRKWYHFKCVGVGPEIKSLHWICQICLQKVTAVVSLKMFSVIKAEKKIFNSNIQTIPDLWFRARNSQKYILCPLNLSRKAFNNAVRNRLNPISSWQKIDCQVLESKFKTYELAKATEDSITRNLQKRNTERLRNTVNGANNANEIEGAIVESASVQRQTLQNNLDCSSEIEKMIAEKVEIALTKHLEGLGVNTVISSNSIGCLTGDSRPSDIVDFAHSDIETINLEQNETESSNSKTSEATEPFGSDPNDIEAVGFDGMHVSDINLPVKELLQLKKLEFELVEKYDYFDRKIKAKGSKKLYTTMRLVSDKVISDNLLKLYSYEGQRRGSKSKLPFKVYKNVTQLIVRKTMDAFNNYNEDENEFKPLSEDAVLAFFKSNFIKYAEQRVQQK